MLLLTLLLAVLTFTASVHSFAFRLINKTAKNIYVYTSADGPNCADGHVGTCSSETVKLANGATYTSPYTLRIDAHGIAIKAAWEHHSQQDYEPNYLVEVSKKTGWLWYNFSAVEGNVFSGIARTLSAPSCPHVAHCDTGSDSCNWFAEPNGGDGQIHVCTHIPGELVAVIGEQTYSHSVRVISVDCDGHCDNIGMRKYIWGTYRELAPDCRLTT